MKLTPLILAGACLALNIPAGGTAFAQAPVAAADRSLAPEIAAARAIFAGKSDSVVWISAVCKISFTAEGANIPEQDKKIEALGTIVGADGLIVSALSTIDVSREITGREVSVGGKRIKVDASMVIRDLQVIMPDGTEVPAEIVLKDVDLDLAFIRIKAEARETKGVTFKAVDLKDNAKVAVGDEVVSLGRLDEVLNRQPTVMRGQVIAMIKKPREFIRVTSAAPGTPTFSLDGKVAGIAVNRHMKNRPPVAVLIPASEIAELAAQARASKTGGQEEPK